MDIYSIVWLFYKSIDIDWSTKLLSILEETLLMTDTIMTVPPSWDGSFTYAPWFKMKSILYAIGSLSLWIWATCDRCRYMAKFNWRLLAPPFKWLILLEIGAYSWEAGTCYNSYCIWFYAWELLLSELEMLILDIWSESNYSPLWSWSYNWEIYAEA